MPTHASVSNERTLNRLPKQGEHKASPLLWTMWFAKRLRSIVGEPWLVDKYIPCGRLAAGIKQHWILSFTRQQSPIGASLGIPIPETGCYISPVIPVE